MKQQNKMEVLVTNNMNMGNGGTVERGDSGIGEIEVRLDRRTSR